MCPVTRYTAVAMILHWLVAIGIFALIVMGLLMDYGNLAAMTKFKIYQLHKSVGITVLLLVVLRVLWRLGHRPPALPAHMPPLERKVAEGAHVVLYLLMFGLPLSGWLYVSVAPLSLPTVLYGLIPWPHLTFLAQWIDKGLLATLSKFGHTYGAWLLIAALAGHILAALRHHFIIRDDVLLRMLPRWRRAVAPAVVEESPRRERKVS